MRLSDLLSRFPIDEYEYEFRIDHGANVYTIRCRAEDISLQCSESVAMSTILYGLQKFGTSIRRYNKEEIGKVIGFKWISFVQIYRDRKLVASFSGIENDLI